MGMKRPHSEIVDGGRGFPGRWQRGGGGRRDDFGRGGDHFSRGGRGRGGWDGGRGRGGWDGGRGGRR